MKRHHTAKSLSSNSLGGHAAWCLCIVCGLTAPVDAEKCNVVAVRKVEGGQLAGVICAPENASCCDPKTGTCKTQRVARTRNGCKWYGCVCDNTDEDKKKGKESKSGTTSVNFDPNRPRPYTESFAFAGNFITMEMPLSLGGIQIVPGASGSLDILFSDTGDPNILSLELTAISGVRDPMTIGQITTSPLQITQLPDSVSVGEADLTTGEFTCSYVLFITDNQVFTGGTGMVCYGVASGVLDFDTGILDWEMEALAIVPVCEPFITTGTDGIVDTLAAGNDIQDIPLGNGRPGSVGVLAPSGSLVQSIPGGDDEADDFAVLTGDNGICETVASGGDVQIIAVGQGEPFAAAVGAGPNAQLDTLPSLDDTVEPSAPCGTPVPTVSEWGLMVMALLLLVAGTIVLGKSRRRLTDTA